MLWAMRAGKEEEWEKGNSVHGPALVCTYLISISLLLDNSLPPLGQVSTIQNPEKSKLFWVCV